MTNPPIDTVEHVEPDARTDATVDDGGSTASIDSILSRFDAAIERLQTPLESESEDDSAEAGQPEAAAESVEPLESAELGVDTGPSPVPDLELPVSPDLDDDVDVDVDVDRDAATDGDVAGELFAELDTEPAENTPAVSYPIADVPDDLDTDAMVSIRGLTKHFDDVIAAENVSFDIRSGTIVGIVGPNGAGKTTTLSMVTGMLRPDAGAVLIAGEDMWQNPEAAKKHLGIVPDRMRAFDRLTGAQLLHYAGVLRGLDAATVRERTTQLASALGITDALARLVDDYSSGMMKKLALAIAVIHSPKVLVLDEPFEAVDPVSVAVVVKLLREFAAAGGAVVLSSHSLGLIQDLCDEVAVIVGGRVIAAGTVDEVRGDESLEDRFIALVRDDEVAEDMEWLHSFSG
ncbi:MAG: ABC transporter ATP-binding protein [Cryobacterium sp.]|nr:ABC transporter ATP-binding protein [Cryobacterium sp.]